MQQTVRKNRPEQHDAQKNTDDFFDSWFLHKIHLMTYARRLPPAGALLLPENTVTDHRRTGLQNIFIVAEHNRRVAIFQEQNIAALQLFALCDIRL